MTVWYQEQDGTGNQADITTEKKCTKANVRLRTPDDGQKGFPKHVES
jgi:hypothetical protein